MPGSEGDNSSSGTGCQAARLTTRPLAQETSLEETRGVRMAERLSPRSTHAPTPSVTPFVDVAFLDFKLWSCTSRATSGRPLPSTTRSVLQDPTTGAAVVLCQITDTRPLPSTTRSVRQDPTTRQITETRGEFSEEEVPQSADSRPRCALLRRLLGRNTPADSSL